MPRHRLTARPLFALLGALLAAAALSAAAGAQAPAGWQRTDLRPVTQPAPAGGLFVTEVSQNGGLRVIGVDPASGRTVWSQLASASRVRTAEAPALGVFGSTVVYLARAVGSTARLVAADAATGATRWQSALGSFTSYPSACPDTPGAVCVLGTLAGGPRGVLLRVDAATGALLPSPDVAGTEGFDAGPGLEDSAEDPERLSAVRGGAVAWTRPVTALFGDSATDQGVNIDRLESAGLFVGSVGPNGQTRGKRFVVDLADDRTVGLRIADARRAWRGPGFYACHNVVCPGLSQAGFNLLATEPTLGIRVVSRGTFSGPDDSDAPLTLSRNARSRIEGFDPATGRARWRFAVGRDPDVVLQNDLGAQTGPLQIVRRDARGRLRTLDLATGRVSSATSRGWCRRDRVFHQTVGFVGDSGDVDHVYLGQQGLLPCSTATERRVATPAAVPAFVGAIGATAAGLVAWTDTTGLFARPVAP